MWTDTFKMVIILAVSKEVGGWTYIMDSSDKFDRRYQDKRRQLSVYGATRTEPSPHDRYASYFLGKDTSTDSYNAEELPGIPEPGKKLFITSVNLQIWENVRKHHTKKYKCVQDQPGKPAELVVRRGLEFKITIHFDQPYDSTKHGITMSFVPEKVDDYPDMEVSFEVNENRDPSYRPTRWGATILQTTGRSTTVEVFAPATAQVGEWGLNIVTVVDGKFAQYSHDKYIIMLFNPWCKEDAVYLPDDVWRKVSVLGDTGRLYVGNRQQIDHRDWNYEQFEDGILEAAFRLIRSGFNFHNNKQMGNAMKVSRILAEKLNFNGSSGVIEVKWSQNYDGGVDPKNWKGSKEILSVYEQTNRPVKYGEDSVFAGVLTTLCRAVGIPCRAVTNFASARNSDKDNLSCDTYYRQENGKWVQDTSRSRDTVKDYDVWNEVWMSRPDLAGDYGGWQVIDALSKTTNTGIFTLGPVPLKAVKEGAIHVGQDTASVFAGVNSDKVEWRIHPNGTVEEFSRETDQIGLYISTKQAGSDSRLDLTDQYKYPEGTLKERQIVEKAERLFVGNQMSP